LGVTTTSRRATPADPMPGAGSASGVPSGVPRRLPPDVGPDAVAILDGPTFMYSDSGGDVGNGTIGGLVHNDTRYLSHWELTINGATLHVLRTHIVDPYSAVFVLTNPESADLLPNSLVVRRQRFVGDGLHERIDVECVGGKPASIRLRLAVGVDFADMFEIKTQIRDRSAQISRDHAGDGSRLAFRYRNGDFAATTEVEVSTPADQVDGDDLVWHLQLGPRERWRCELTVPLGDAGQERRPTRRDFGQVFAHDPDDPASRWKAAAPHLREGAERFRPTYETALTDLAAMRIERSCRRATFSLPAAGVPWFLTIFGRDSLITAFQTVSFGQRLAFGALLALADSQGTSVDDFRDEEPGKIMHEIRNGELTRLGIKPHNPYYGGVDTTPLWLIVLNEYWRWTRDDDLVLQLRSNAYAALRWIDEYGDRDRDGYVEYATRSSEGLGNQCWRDSPEGIHFADGSLPYLPIATCETQGYVYEARLRLAELADGPYQDPQLSERLRVQAAELRDRFNRDFWLDERGGYYAVGLDGDKRPIDAMTSNMGHLLSTGIVPPERAAVIARQLMSDDMFSGWGVRTTSMKDEAYNPIGYHQGTVWPHDNSIVAYGLSRCGFRAEANRIITAMLEAAEHTGYRLPEAFSGFDRALGLTPVPYPTACSPQIWASAAPLLFLRTLLGLEAVDGRLVLDPLVPESFGRIVLTGVSAFGQRWDVTVEAGRAEVRPAS
jgi:glycogen debranching enzyme